MRWPAASSTSPRRCSCARCCSTGCGLSSKGVRRGKTGFSTDVDVLTRLASEHPLPARLLRIPRPGQAQVDLRRCAAGGGESAHRPLAHLLQSNGRRHRAAQLERSQPAKHPHPRRGGQAHSRRLHCAAGSRLLGADYSQIELRLLAHLSRDPVLVDAFRRGDDVHARTAAEVFGVLPGRHQRGDAPCRQGHQFRYTVRHGRAASGARAADSRPRGGALHRQLLRALCGRACLSRPHHRGGARARLRQHAAGSAPRGARSGSRERGVAQAAERTATNTPIQGSAADLIKLAMVAIDRRLATRAGARP